MTLEDNDLCTFEKTTDLRWLDKGPLRTLQQKSICRNCYEVRWDELPEVDSRDLNENEPNLTALPEDEYDPMDDADWSPFPLGVYDTAYKPLSLGATVVVPRMREFSSFKLRVKAIQVHGCKAFHLRIVLEDANDRGSILGGVDYTAHEGWAVPVIVVANP